MIALLERLASAGIAIIPMPGAASHFFLERDGFVALVQRAGDGFGPIGSAGRLTEQGFAVLVWRGEEAFFVARGYDQLAPPDAVAALRRFDSDLRSALTP
ncbi:MAG: hypothetical protein ABI693_02620 [Bryobacteraceae bacterium]